MRGLTGVVSRNCDDSFKDKGTMIKKKKPHGIGASESFRASHKKGGLFSS
jgi:hypothetical protein